VLGIEFRTLSMLGKHPAIEVNSQPLLPIYTLEVVVLELGTCGPYL
jgi:hypothetical protein